LIIRGLTLNNFRRFKHLDLADLPVGLIGIIGENGSGKSTILEAVGWALYGTYALTDRTSKEGVKTQSADANANCEVEIEFEMAGDIYKVVRRLQGKRAIAQAFVYKNDKDEAVAEREDGVNTYISKLFGMDRNTFFASVFARQKELDLLTSQNPAARQQIIRRLLRVDLIDLAIKDIRQDCRQKKDLAANLKGMITDVSTIATEIKDLLEKQKSMTKEQKVNEEKFSNIKKELKSAKVKKQELESKRKTFQQIHTALVRIEKEIQGKSEQSKKRSVELEELLVEKKELTKIEPKENEYLSVKKTLEKLEDVRGLYEEKKSLEKDLSERLDDLAKVTQGKQKLTESLSKYKGLADKKEKLQERLKNERANHKSISKEINVLSAKSEACSVSIQQLEGKKKNIEKLGPKSKCPECSQDLGTNYERILEHFNEEIEKQSRLEEELDVRIKKEKAKARGAEEAMAEIESNLESIHEDEKKESGIKSNLQVEEKRITALTESAMKRKARISEIGSIEFCEEKYEELKKKFKELVKPHERVMKLRTTTARIPILSKEIKALNENISGLVKEKLTKEKEQKDVDFSEKELDATTESYEQLQSKAHDQEMAIEQIKHDIEMIKTGIARKEEDIKRQEEMQKKWQAAESETKKLADLDDLMDKFRQNLAGRIRPMMVARTSQLVANTTSGRYTAVDLDDEYNIYIYDGTEPFLVNRFSGGEQDLVNLCLRVAISQIISEQNSRTGINFIALDEIFGSQDAGRKENILKALNNLSGQFRQIFLITHHEDLKDSMQHVLVVDEAEEGASTAIFAS
jgi:DNA repair protein SbcC/Rad50